LVVTAAVELGPCAALAGVSTTPSVGSAAGELGAAGTTAGGAAGAGVATGVGVGAG
jgi:hypothetical protein